MCMLEPQKKAALSFLLLSFGFRSNLILSKEQAGEKPIRSLDLSFPTLRENMYIFTTFHAKCATIYL